MEICVPKLEFNSKTARFAKAINRQYDIWMHMHVHAMFKFQSIEAQCRKLLSISFNLLYSIIHAIALQPAMEERIEERKKHQEMSNTKGKITEK